MFIETYMLLDDGAVPNNPALPLVHYREAFDERAEAQEMIDRFFRNGWTGAWINGIFDFHHYHARSHEVLGNAGGSVQVQFGGRGGPMIDFLRGDAVVVPAGVGHCRVSASAGLVIVGAYPIGQEDWDLKRADRAGDYARALREIPNVELPASDPVIGGDGQLLTVWHK